MRKDMAAVSPEPAAAGRWTAGWRALIATWVVLGLGLAGSAGWLAWLGPPERPPSAETSAPAAAPPGAAPAATGAPAGESGGKPAGAPPPAEAPAARLALAEGPVEPPSPRPSVPPGATPVALPAAPEPPPLTAAELGLPTRPQPDRPIPPPDPELLEPGPHGLLPRIGPGGRTSFRTYGHAFDRRERRPRVGLIVGGLGLNAALTEEAIRRLPGAVTLAFSPYAPHVARLLDPARARGMEVLVALPLEPTGYPLNNPGDRALLTGLSPAENQDRLDWVLSRFAGYVGAIGAHGPMRGERFALLADRLAALQEELRARGLLYVDPRPGARGPERAWGRSVDVLVDEPATRGEIEIRLGQLERLARERGSALGYAGEGSPVLVERVASWAAMLESRGLVLAPVSALIRPPADSAEAATASAHGALRAE